MKRRNHGGKGYYELCWEPCPETVAWFDALAEQYGQTKRPVATEVITDLSHEPLEDTTNEYQEQLFDF